MSLVTRLLLLAALLTPAAQRRVSAEVIDIFLQLAGISGESTVPAYENWIEVESFSSGVQALLSAGSGGGSGGRPSHSDLALRKRLDGASLALVLHCNTGQPISTGTLEFTRLVGTTKRFYQVRLADIRVTSVHVGGSGAAADSIPEQISLSYQGIESIYTQYTPDGSPLPDLFAWWNVPANLGGNTAVACVTAAPSTLSGVVGTTNTITVMIPPLLTTTTEATVTLVPDDPTIASFSGGADGRATVIFPMADPSPRTANLVLRRPGTTTVRLVRTDSCIANSVAVAVQGSLLRNPSFEENYPSAPPHYGAVDGWDGSQGVGVSQSDGPFQDNGRIPDRDQVAFLQGSTVLSQQVTGLEPGRSYWLQFCYNARDCCGGTIGLVVRFDGAEIAALRAIAPVGGVNAYLDTNVLFTPTVGAGRLEFVTTANGDATLLLDAVTLVQRDPADRLVRNPSFEASGLPPGPGYLQPKPLAGWTGSGNYGVNAEAGSFADNGAVPDQQQVAFLQNAGSALSQTLHGLAVGEEHILTFAANARAGNTPHLKVTFADAVLVDEEIAPVGGVNPYLLRSAVFRPSAPDGILQFEQTASGDNTVLLDNIRVVRGVPVQPTVALAVALTTARALRVSWPSSATGFKLQTTATLGDGWLDVTVPAAVEGTEAAVYLPPSAQSQYFRLRK